MEVAAAAQALLTAPGRADPYPLYDVLRGCAPVLTVSERSTVVTGYAEAGQILRDPAFRVTDASIVDRDLPGWRDHAALDWLANSMLWHNPPGHERMRTVVSRAFTPVGGGAARGG